MKKILAFALCLATVLSMITVQAEEICMHPESTVTEEWYSKDDYRPADNASHAVSGIRIEVMECTACGQKTEKSLGTKMLYELHDYDSEGRCKYCGHKNTCEHLEFDHCLCTGCYAFTEHSNAYEDLYSRVYTTNRVDDSQHRTRIGLFVRILCPDCTSELDNYFHKFLYEYEEHSYIDSYCSKCRYRCTHTGMSQDERETETYQKIDGNYVSHNRIITADQINRCPTCGFVESFGPSKTTTKAENHSYNTDGICEKCGFVNICKHDGSETYAKDCTETIVMYSDPNQHMVVERRRQEIYCGECNELIEKIWGNTSETLERHEYKNNFCVKCDLFNPCMHEVGESESQIFVTVGDCISNEDGMTHKKTGYWENQYTCINCGETEFVLRSETKTVTEEHIYENGICSLCGHICLHGNGSLMKNGVCSACNYASNCVHKNREVGLYPKSEEYEPLDAKQHIYQYEQWEATKCTDCGELLSDMLIQNNIILYQNHFYAHGECRLCGLENLCQHNSTRVESDTAAVKHSELDAQHHKTTYSTWDTTICNDCGEMLFATESNEWTENETHCFEDGICEACGYQPDMLPTATPASTAEPTAAPTAVPTADPTVAPSAVPTTVPTADPTVAPSAVPTAVPTADPTVVPSAVPTVAPTALPTARPIATLHPNRTELNTTGWITGDSVNVRTEPNTNCNSLGQVHYGVELQVIAAVKNGDGVTWYEVTYMGRTAYIHGNLVTLVSKPGARPTAAFTTETNVVPVVGETFIEQLISEKKPMVETIVAVLERIELTKEETGVKTTVEIANMDNIVTSEEKEVLDTLPVKEQILIVLTALGHKEAVETMLNDTESSLVISNEAQTVLTSVTERLEKMTEEEQKAYEEILLEHFPVEEIELEDGGKQQYFAIELVITQDETTHIERYGFRCDKESETWIFSELTTA